MNAQGNSTADDSLLTIAIPTYNRCKELSQLLEWIDTYAPLQVKVVVRDNASTDGTWEMLQNWKKKTKRDAAIFRNPENLGIDYNILKVAEDSTTEWFWWMGDDDLFDPETPAVLNKIIETNNKLGFIYLNSRHWDGISSSPRGNFSTKLTKSKYYTAGNERQVLETIFEHFGYISSLVVKTQIFKLYLDIKPKRIASTGFDFLWPLVHIISNYDSYIELKPLIWYRAGREWSGIKWIDAYKNFIIVLAEALGNKKFILNYRKFYNHFTINSLIPKLRSYINNNRISIFERFALVLQLIPVFWFCITFWTQAIPRILLLKIKL